MSTSDLLPKFEHPPVDEVAVGVQFTAQGFLPTHYGAFHERIKSEFPGVQVMPPIVPTPDNASTIQLELGQLPWPRVLFVAADDCSLIQIQNDRLYFNWRRRSGKEYPHYRYIREGFSRAYSVFETVATVHGFGPIMPNQCDVLYVNPLPPSVTGVDTTSPEKVLRVWNSVGEEWSGVLEDLAFNARYQILDSTGASLGRLMASLSTAYGSENVPLMRLELVARGRPPEANLDGVLTFHDIGHEAIVRCFAAITTQDMHRLWGRVK